VIGRRQARRVPPAAFRPSAPAGSGRAPSRTQLVALLTGLVVVAAGIAIASFVVKPSKARSFQLFYGSIYLNDNASPVAVDLASGKPTVRLSNSFTAVSAKATSDLSVYPLAGGNTLMLNPGTGEFNMVDSTGFVVKTTGGGVKLPAAPGSSVATAVPSGSSAYILRRDASRTSIYLVNSSTVSSAIGARAKARAYATLAHPLVDDGVSAASANGSLWLLTGASGQPRTITELSVPQGSNAGVTLNATAHGTVSGPAAVEAVRLADGSGTEVPAVASARAVTVFSGGDATTVPVPADPGVDQILPAGNALRSLIFLYHSSRGWSSVTVPASGADKAKVTPLTAIPADAKLAVPAQSAGSLYTMERTGSGAMWQIRSRGGAEVVPGTDGYPLKTSERGQFDGVQVVGDDRRVIFNSRGNYLAEVVFSDGSRAPRVIEKHSAVLVDPAGATTLADAHSAGSSQDTTQDGKSNQKPPKAQRPAQTINDKIDCKTAKQVPHIPTLIAGERASRSIGLTWNYPVLDPTDCIPSTYVVGIKVRSGDAPSPPSSRVTVQGENGVTLTHLFPATEYEMTVTAFINKQSSTSAPLLVTTGPEGPAAPTDVRATTDSSGNWTVSWNSCGGVAQGCVPSQTWTVLPHFCDGRGLSNVPEPVTVPGDESLHTFARVYPGSDALLGRALCFQVQGVSPQGTVGDTSAQTAPAYSWRVPNAAALTLDASQPQTTELGGTATTTLQLDLGADPVRDVGGVGATVALTLTGPDGPKTKTVTWDGRTDRVTAVFPGIEAGAQYTAKATVAPPHHPSSAVSTAPVTVTTSARWPAISAHASCPTGDQPIVLDCTLNVQLSGPSSAAANGEKFDLTDSRVVCGNTGFELTKNGFDPANDPITQNVDLLQYNGSCTVRVVLVESGATTGTKVFGGTTSPVISTTVDLGHASTLDAGQGDFAVNWSATQNGYVRVRYTGGKSDQQVAAMTQGWSEQVNAPGVGSCGSSGSQPTHDGILIAVDSDCIKKYGGRDGWTVAIAYFDRGTSQQHSYTEQLTGTPSGFVPCTVNGTFTAKWAGDYRRPVILVDYTPGSGDNLDGCVDWNYVANDPIQGSCGSVANQGPSTGEITIVVDEGCRQNMTPAGWTVDVSWDGPDPGRHGQSQTAGVDGTPPPSPTPTPTPTPPPTPPPTPSPSGT
jgi:hypothetical protein